MNGSLTQMLADREALEGVAGWLKTQKLKINIGPVQGDHNEYLESPAGWLLRLVRAALAERALEPQEGQALPELPEPRCLGGDEAYGDAVYGYSDGDMCAYARAYASQLALPAGPVPELRDEVAKLVLAAHNVTQSPTPTFVSVLGDRARAVAALLSSPAERAVKAPAGPVPEGELKEILGDLWDEGYVSPATYNDVDIRDPEERQRMRDHNVSEAQRRIAAALSAPASPAVAQPVADERARPTAPQVMEWARLRGFGYALSAEQICGLADDIIAHMTAATPLAGQVINHQAPLPDWYRAMSRMIDFCVPVHMVSIARLRLQEAAALCPPAEEGGKS